MIEQSNPNSKVVRIFKRSVFESLGRKLPSPVVTGKIPTDISGQIGVLDLTKSPTQTIHQPHTIDLTQTNLQSPGLPKNIDLTQTKTGDAKPLVTPPLIGSKIDTTQLPTNIDLTKTSLQDPGLPKNINLIQTNLADVPNLVTPPLVNSKTDVTQQPINIDLLKSTVDTIIIQPFGTVLAFQSRFGDIFVKPQQALTDLFDKVLEPQPVNVNQTDKLINSPIDTIFDKIPDSKLLDLKTVEASTQETSITSVLSHTQYTTLVPTTNVLLFNTPAGQNIPITSVSDHIGVSGEFTEIPITSVLKFFQSTLNFNTVDVLSLETAESRIRDFRTDSVLTIDKTDVGNLVIKDTVTILSIYQNSGIASSIPTPVDSFTLNAPTEITQIDVTKIPPRIQPEPFIENATPGVSQLQDESAVLSKILESNQFVTNKAFVIDSNLRVTNLDVNKIVAQIPSAELSITDSFTKKDTATDFEKTDLNIGQQAANIEAFNFKAGLGVINQFVNYYPNNIAPNAANGDLSFTTFVDYQVRKTIGVSVGRPTDFSTPVFPIGNVSQVTGNRQYYDLPIEYRAYTDPSEKVPTITNQFQDIFTGAMTTIAGGLMNSTAFQGLQSVLGVDFTPLRQSAVGIAPIAGEIYFKTSGIDSELQAVTLGNTATTQANSLLSTIQAGARIATSIATTFIPTDVFKNDAPEYALIVAQILAGTKYTAAYAFYDPLAKSYSSKYFAIGENAANWYYNDGTSEQTNPDLKKYESTDPSVLDTQFRLSIRQRFESTLNNFSNQPSNFDDPLTNIQKTSTTIKNIIRNPSVTDIFGLNTSGTRTGIPLLGLEYQNLKVPSILLHDSFTFGSFAAFFTNLKYGYWGGYRTAGNDTATTPSTNITLPTAPSINIGSSPSPGPVSVTTLDNGPASPDINYSNTPENDIVNFQTDAPLETPSVIDTSLRTFQSPTVPRPVTVDGQLTYPLGGYTQKLKDALVAAANNSSIKRNTAAQLGIPDKEENNYVDVKNASELFVIENNAEFVDSDLIDFYFEDITSDPNGRRILLPFRAIITSYTDNTSADWQTNQYVGRPDKFYIYSGFDRRIGIAFEVAINSKAELLTSWRKLNYLQGLCYPTSYPGNVSMTAPLMTITIGALLERVFVVMNSVSFDFDAATIWELEKGAEANFQLPMIVRVGVDFNVLFDALPITNAHHFAQNEAWMDPILFDYRAGDRNNAGTALGVSNIQKNPSRKRVLRNSTNSGGVIIDNA